jgi:hypothetical protein
VEKLKEGKLSLIIIHQFDVSSDLTQYLMFTGMRNSWESHAVSDSTFVNGIFTLGMKDRELAQRLTKAGADHGKYLRQISIVVDLTAPEYFLKEFDTYKVGTTRNSTSMMHTLGKHNFSASFFSWENMPIASQRIILDTLSHLRDAWIEAGKKKGPESDEWRAMVQAVPQSWNYRSTWSANYQVLRNMYHARKYHRLKEWRDWCSWIETLPLGDLICIS